MQIIISRKGLDSSTAKKMSISKRNSFAEGCSPIYKDGSMVSLPISDDLEGFNSYKDTFYKDKSFEKLFKELHGIEPTLNNLGAHLDPDLSKDSKKRLSGWKPNFGQSSGAQGKLKKEGISKGDLFLFFGRFSQFDFDYDESFDARRNKGKGEIHCFFGWLQTEQPLDAKYISNKPWLEDHPHRAHSTYKKHKENRIYISTDSLSLDSQISGAGHFKKYNENLLLSNPDERLVSSWLLPKWFLDQDEKYRPDKIGCWSRAGDKASCSSHYKSFPQTLKNQVGQWQETVFDTDDFPEAKDWALDIIKSGLGVE